MLSEQPGSFTFGLVASSENDSSDRITIKCILEGIYIWSFHYDFVVRAVKMQRSDQV